MSTPIIVLNVALTEHLEVPRPSRNCRAVVEFATLESAEMNAGGLAEARLGSLNCAQGIQVPPDADPNSPVRAELFLDCTDLRANRVDTLQ